jgi:hypothetical protein
MMQIDTVHSDDSSQVNIKMDNDAERALTDEEWARVANNQHKLKWINGHGYAALPAVLRGPVPSGDVKVKRDGDRIIVVFPLEA